MVISTWKIAFGKDDHHKHPQRILKSGGLECLDDCVAVPPSGPSMMFAFASSASKPKYSVSKGHKLSVATMSNSRNNSTDLEQGHDSRHGDDRAWSYYSQLNPLVRPSSEKKKKLAKKGQLKRTGFVASFRIGSNSCTRPSRYKGE